MWKQYKQDYREFKKAEPGQRFIGAYERGRARHRGPAHTILILVVAIVLIVGGALLALIPGVPGIIPGMVGLALIATRFRRMAIWLDWFEVAIRKAGRACRQVFAGR